MSSAEWLSIASAAFQSGFYFKDLTRAPIPSVQWGRVAIVDDPLVLRLSREQLDSVLQSLTQEGIGAATDCAIMEDTPAGQNAALFATLGSIAARARALPAPSLLLFVADDLQPLRNRLAALTEQGLRDKTVLVTRSRRQAGELTSLLHRHGARVLEVPTIEIRPIPAGLAALQDALSNINRYGWMIVTSANTVQIINERLKAMSLGWDVFSEIQVACIGTATARAVREAGGHVSLVPPNFQAESLVEALLAEGMRNSRILLPRAEGSREVLPTALSQSGAIVEEIQIYRSDVPESSRRQLKHILDSERIDFLTFTSSSTVHNFVELAGSLLKRIDLEKTRIACIGPITAATLKEYGLPPAIQANEFTIPGLVQAILNSVRS